MHTWLEPSSSPGTPLTRKTISATPHRSPDDPSGAFPGLIEIDQSPSSRTTRSHFLASTRRPLLSATLLAALLAPQAAHASLFEGETLDAVANGVSWVAIVLVPLVGITVFWLVHILPEKIAHNKRHPQTRAIQCLCLLSLCFGGLLWPLAWLWAYTKPVLHKLAYGTDVDDSHDHDDAKGHDKKPSEVETLRARVAELEAKLSTKGGNI